MINEGSGIFSHVTYLSPGIPGPIIFERQQHPSGRWFRLPVPAGKDHRKYKVGQTNMVLAFDWNLQFHYYLEKVMFILRWMTGQDVSNGVWITGNMTGLPEDREDDQCGDNIYRTGPPYFHSSIS
jgi:hypothetical protein